MSKALVISVGTGRNREDIAHCIKFSISQKNPEYIVFIVTEKSEKETMPIVLKDLSIKYEICKISDENDVEKIASECNEFLKKLRYRPEEIAIDFTSGTKPMSAGLLYAGLENDIGTIVYITGERDHTGRVLPGTEREISFSPNKIYAEKLLNQAIFLFNIHQFDGCKETLQKVKGLIFEQEYEKNVSLLEQLAEAYSQWDKFNLEKAFKTLNSIDKESKDLLMDWRIKKNIDDNKQFLYKEKSKNFCIERAVDLLENALRRGDVENKYDDAVARLYRLLEYIAQIKLNEKQLYKPDNNECVVDCEKLPENLKRKYQQYEGKLGLVKSYELLDDLKEKIGSDFMEEWNKKKGEIKNLINLRNKSILAHGFNQVEEKTYQEMKDFVIRFMDRNWSEFESSRKRAKFPQIHK